MRALRQHVLNRRHDADIAGAAAEIARQLFADARLVGLGQAGDDVISGSQHAGRAIAALQRVMTAEGIAQQRHHRVVVEALHRAHVRAGAGDGVAQARTHRTAVDHHGAGAADAVLAAEMGAGEIELLAHEVGEMRARRDGPGHFGAVDAERERTHATPSPLCARTMARRSAATCSACDSSERCGAASFTASLKGALPFQQIATAR